MILIGSKEMQKASTTSSGFKPGKVYEAWDGTYGRILAMFVKTVGAVGTAGSPMYPKTASFNVSGEFLCDDNEDGDGVVGQEWCLGSWLGGVTTAAGYGFVQMFGWNLVTITTDNSVEANDIVLPKSTDGTWYGLARSVLRTDATAVDVQGCGFAPAADGGTTMTAGKVFWNVLMAHA